MQHVEITVQNLGLKTLSKRSAKPKRPPIFYKIFVAFFLCGLFVSEIPKAVAFDDPLYIRLIEDIANRNFGDVSSMLKDLATKTKYHRGDYSKEELNAITTHANEIASLLPTESLTPQDRIYILFTLRHWIMRGTTANGEGLGYAVTHGWINEIITSSKDVRPELIDEAFAALARGAGDGKGDNIDENSRLLARAKIADLFIHAIEVEIDGKTTGIPWLYDILTDENKVELARRAMRQLPNVTEWIEVLKKGEKPRLPADAPINDYRSNIFMWWSFLTGTGDYESSGQFLFDRIIDRTVHDGLRFQAIILLEYAGTAAAGLNEKDVTARTAKAKFFVDAHRGVFYAAAKQLDRLSLKAIYQKSSLMKLPALKPVVRHCACLIDTAAMHITTFLRKQIATMTNYLCRAHLI